MLKFRISDDLVLRPELVVSTTGIFATKGRDDDGKLAFIDLATRAQKANA